MKEILTKIKENMSVKNVFVIIFAIAVMVLLCIAEDCKQKGHYNEALALGLTGLALTAIYAVIYYKPYSKNRDENE